MRDREMPIMQVTLTDRDPAEVYVLDLDRMPMAQAEECEKLTGWTRKQWLDALYEDRARAVKFFIYLAALRAADGDDTKNPLEWDAIDFDLAQTEWEAVPDPDAPADTPAQLGVSEEGPTGPEAETSPPPDE